MGIASSFFWHFKEEGRFNSFTVHYLGVPLLAMSAAMGLCFDLLARPETPDVIHVAVLLGFIASIICLFMFKGKRPRASVGILTLLLMYAASILFCAVPYMAYGFSFQSSLFESLSGITTTGLSVIHTSEMSSALLIWRALTGWMGGFMFIAFFSLYVAEFGIPGRYLFESGSASVDSDFIKPQILKIAIRYGEVYLASTILMSVLLMISGVGFLTSVSLSMSTVSTTGFMDFHGGLTVLSVPARIIICVFMAATMLNFTTAFFALVNRSLRPFREDNEILYMAIWILLVSVITLVILIQNGIAPDDGEEFLDFVLTVLSVGSTTGFMAVDYSWPTMVLLILILGAFVGGSIDSPTGGVKVLRGAIALKLMAMKVTEVSFPNEVVPVKVRGVNVDLSLSYAALLTIVLFIAMLIFGTIAISFTETDMVTAFGMAASALTTTGKGLYIVGTEQELNIVAKYVMAVLMIVGRLEVVTVIMLLSPEYWRDLFARRRGIRQTINDMRQGSLQQRGFPGQRR